MSLHQRTSSFDIARSNIAGAHVNGLSRPDSSASKSAYRHIDAFHNTDENLQKTQRTRSGSKSNSPTGVVGDVESLDFGLPSIPHGSKRSRFVLRLCLQALLDLHLIPYQRCSLTMVPLI